MYLSHINLKLKGKNSDLKFKEFIDIIEEETITRLDTKTQSDKKRMGFLRDRLIIKKEVI
jgi:hypothetical protein